MASDPHKRLRETFGGSEWVWLRDKVRHLFEQEKPLPATMRCPHASASQRRAIGAVLGKPEGAVVVPLEVLEERLQAAGLCDSLREMVEILDGPIVPKARHHREAEANWEDFAARAGELLTEFSADVELHPDISTPPFWKRISHRDRKDAEALLDQVICFLRQVSEWKGQAPTRVAAALYGNSHALDRDTALFRALASISQLDAALAREVWEFFGLVADEVSSHALVLGLQFQETGTFARGLNAFAESGQPTRILLRHFREPLELSIPKGRLHVCENPSILEAAADGGLLCHPLLCVEGNPSQACMDVLGLAVKAGAEIHYHGDFDWGGVRIANRVRTHVEGRFIPWQYDCNAYLKNEGGHPLCGTALEAEWDPDLAQAMQDRGVGIHEEQVTEEILAELSRTPPTRIKLS